MIKQGFAIMAQVFGVVISWFEQLLAKENFDRYLLFALFIVMGYNFLLDPLLRRGSSGGSDYASSYMTKKLKEEKTSKSKSSPKDKMSDKK